MLKYTRQEKILSLLKDNGSVNLTDLVSYFGNTSRSTLRRDLIELSERQPISITHGGAVFKEEPGNSQNTDFREFDPFGRKAVELINNGDSIFIDAGRTAHSVANALLDSDLQNLTIITTTPAVLNTLSLKKNPNWNIIMLGGEFRGQLRSVVGPLAEKAAESIHVEKLFIGCSSLDEKGFYTNYLSEVSLRNIAIQSASEVILLMRDNKFTITRGYLVNSLDKISVLITNTIPDDKEKLLHQHHIRTLITE